MEVNLGMYVDQLWINHVPIYFDRVFVTKHLGLNCAYWNLHERHFSIKNNCYLVNEKFELLFFHFSALNIYDTNNISKSQNRYNLVERTDLVSLVTEYAKKLIDVKADGSYNVRCVYSAKSILQKFIYYKKRFLLRIRKTV
jgi:hypothetical protein